MKKTALGKRTFLLGMLIALLFHVEKSEALTSGPAMPEYVQFEPFDATDLVALTTGNFAYTIPLINVPGKGGSFPLALSYHAGIKHGQEASWVGLGWSLNPGAINRAVRGYPDDYFDAYVYSQLYDEGRNGYGIQPQLSVGPFGIGISYDSYTGNVGLNMSIFFVNLGVDTKGDPYIGMNFGISSPVGGVSIDVGTEGWKVSGTIGNKYLGVSFNSNGYATLNIGGQFGLTQPDALKNLEDSDINYYTYFGDFSAGLSIGPIGLGIGFYNYTWFLDEGFIEWDHGYLYQGGLATIIDPKTGEEVVRERPVTDQGKKLESQNESGWHFTSQDIYTCAAQGIHGPFMPYANYEIEYRDYNNKDFKHYYWDDVNNRPINYQNTQFVSSDLYNNSPNRKSNIQFRFLNDLGKNCIGKGLDGDFSGYFNLDETDTERAYGSKLINPIITEQNGPLEGFEIIDSDGKIYEFMMPLKNMIHCSYTTNESKDIGSQFSKYITLTPYAYSWLLTAIKSPDYVDLDEETDPNYGPSDNDYGFWAKITYQGDNPDVENGKYLYNWQTPFDKNKKVSGSTYSGSLGLKEVSYLRKIETATHKAIFHLEDRLDSRGAGFNSIYNVLMGDFGKMGLSGNDVSIQDISDQTPNRKTIRITAKLLAGIESFFSIHPPEYFFEYKLIVSGHNVGQGNLYHDQIAPKLWTLQMRTDDPEITKYIDPVTGLVTIFYDFDWTDWYNNGVVAHPNPLQDVTAITGITNVVFYAGTALKSIIKNQAILNKTKQLTKIELFKKNIGTTVTEETPVKTINFAYDYSLCKNTPNSLASREQGGTQGKLTLKAFTVQGRDGLALPPYSFTYQDGDGNPDFGDIEKYDNWGMYNPSGSIENHMTPQDKGDNIGVVWNLTDVNTPLGTNVHVEYERDCYYGMNANRITAVNLPYSSYYYFSIASKTSWNHKFVLSGDIPEYDYIKEGMKSLVIVDWTGNYLHGQSWDSWNGVLYGGLYTIEEIDHGNNELRFDIDDNFIFTDLNQEVTWRVKKYIMDNDLAGWENGEYTLRPDKTEYSYSILVFKDEGKCYGGDVRVKRLVTSNGMGDDYCMVYDYKKGNSVKTSGWTFKSPPVDSDGRGRFSYITKDLYVHRPSLPYNYNNRRIPDYVDTLDYYREDYCSPSPGVMYSTVTT